MSDADLVPQAVEHLRQLSIYISSLRITLSALLLAVTALLIRLSPPSRELSRSANMSDNDEPSQQPTPSKTPKRPQQPQRSDSDMSVDDPGYESRSRSQSRRRRRQNQRQRAQQQQQQQQQQDGGGGKGAQAQSMAKIDEEQGAEAQSQSENTMQKFERIGMLALDSTFLRLFPRSNRFSSISLCCLLLCFYPSNPREFSTSVPSLQRGKPKCPGRSLILLSQNAP